MKEQETYAVGEFLLTECPQCQEQVPSGDFCGHCQFPLPKLSKRAPKVKCSNCEKEVMQNLYCSACGLSLNDAQLLDNIYKHVLGDGEDES